MILARINGRTIYSRAVRAGKTTQITVTQVLARALMASLGLTCHCGAPATGFQLDADGSKTMGAGDVDEREAVPTCLDCQYAARRAS